MANDIVLKTEGLDKLIKSLKGKLPSARVGVIGEKTVRNGLYIGKGKAVDAQKHQAGRKFNVNTNAAIGLIHEFGTTKIPQRSFLRVPISTMLQKKMESSGAFDSDVLKQVVKSGTITPWLKKIAILAESIVHEAFETGGFGKWPKWKTPGYKNEGNRLLWDTGQLQDSINSEVVNGSD